jgi:WD40 repeat protein
MTIETTPFRPRGTPAALRLSLLLCALAGLAGCAGAPVATSDAARAGTASPAQLRWSLHPGPEPSYINSLDLSADGDRVLTGTFYNDYSKPPSSAVAPPHDRYGVYLHGRDGRLLWKDEFDAQHGVYDVALSARGRYAAAGGWFRRLPDAGLVAIYDATNGAKQVDFHEAPGRVAAVAFSSDERTLAAGGPAVYVFRRIGAAFGGAPLVVPLPAVAGSDGRPDKVTGIVLNRDGTRILVGTIKGQVALIGVTGDDARVLGQFRTEGPVRNVAIAADRAIAAAAAGPGIVYAFDLDRPAAGVEPIWSQRFDGATANFGVALSADGGRVAAAANIGDHGRVGLIDNAGQPGAWLWQSEVPRNPNGVAIDARGTRVAVADGYPNGKPAAFLLFDGTDGHPLWSHPSADMSWPIALSADGRVCAAGSDDGRVYLFE